MAANLRLMPLWIFDEEDQTKHNNNIEVPATIPSIKACSFIVYIDQVLDNCFFIDQSLGEAFYIEQFTLFNMER